MQNICDCQISDPRLDVFRNLRHPRLNEFFIAEGRLVVERLLRSDFETDRLMVAKRKETWVRQFFTQFDVRFSGPILLVPDNQIDSVVGFDFHSGIMAAGIRPLLQSASLDTLPAWIHNHTVTGRPTIFAVLPHIALAENLGAIIRTAWGLGCSGLIVNQRGADPFGRRTLRVSMGHSLSLPVFHCPPDDDRLISVLKHLNVPLAAIEVDRRMVPLKHSRHFPTQALIFGNEIDGVPESWIEAADQIVGIPMVNPVDSLNVAASCAIAMHHFCAASLD